jgi:hypothetical protein
MRPRISLLGLIGLTTLAGLACAALVKPTAEWTSVVVSLCVVAFITQVLRAILYEGVRRAAAVGWLLFVVAYMAVANGPWLGTHLGRRLLTSQAIEQARQKWPETLDQPPPAPIVTKLWQDGLLFPGVVSSGGVLPPDWAPPSPNYFRISAHWLFAWFAGWLGAVVATHFFHRGAARPSSALPLSLARPAA